MKWITTIVFGALLPVVASGQIKDAIKKEATQIADIQQYSFLENLNFKDDAPAVQVICHTSFSKEIRILLKAEQIMKKHKAPFPIVVQVIDGSIEFEVKNQTHQLKKGNIISVESNIPHSLKGLENSVVRVTGYQNNFEKLEKK